MVNNLTCRKCKHFWVSRKERPQQCPRCKRYDWDISIEKLKEEGKNK